MSEYARPDILVSTAWVAQHRHDPELRIVEVDVDTAAYEQGHIPGAVGWSWQTPLCDPLRRDILTKAQFEQLMHESGISPTTLAFYGDNYSWFATYALWQCRYWGHPEAQLQLLNGGRAKWLAEGRPLVPDRPAYPRTSYRAAFPDDNVRATKEVIFHTLLDRGQYNLVAYCRIGERSSHTWFVLKYLLGAPKVRNYDGSWTEWGNLVGAPIEGP